MRFAILSLSLALAMPLIPGTANADAHSCSQLRQGVLNSVPLRSRNLPYALLDCGAIGEIHLLVTTNRHIGEYQINQRIEAVFRREGIIQ